MGDREEKRRIVSYAVAESTHRRVYGAGFEDQIDRMISQSLSGTFPVLSHGSGEPGVPKQTCGTGTEEKYDLRKDAHVVVLHHETFDNGDYNRKGSAKDMEKIRSSMSLYRAQLEEHANLPLVKVRSLMEELMMEDFSNNSCLIVFIMSHGGEGDTILARDCKEYNLHQDVVSKVASNRSLRGKPKMFFVNACRGASGVALDMVSDASLAPTGCDMSDVVIIQSSYQGYVSYRNEHTGSTFMQKFLEVLREKDRLHIGETAMKLTQHLSQGCYKQNTPMTTTLGKALIFGDLRR